MILDLHPGTVRLPDERLPIYGQGILEPPDIRESERNAEAGDQVDHRFAESHPVRCLDHQTDLAFG